MRLSERDLTRDAVCGKAACELKRRNFSRNSEHKFKIGSARSTTATFTLPSTEREQEKEWEIMSSSYESLFPTPLTSSNEGLTVFRGISHTRTFSLSRMRARTYTSYYHHHHQRCYTAHVVTRRTPTSPSHYRTCVNRIRCRCRGTHQTSPSRLSAVQSVYTGWGLQPSHPPSHPLVGVVRGGTCSHSTPSGTSISSLSSRSCLSTV